jgi:hypothetical protein
VRHSGGLTNSNVLVLVFVVVVSSIRGNGHNLKSNGIKSNGGRKRSVKSSGSFLGTELTGCIDLVVGVGVGVARVVVVVVSIPAVKTR